MPRPLVPERDISHPASRNLEDPPPFLRRRRGTGLGTAGVQHESSGPGDIDGHAPVAAPELRVHEHLDVAEEERLIRAARRPELDVRRSAGENVGAIAFFDAFPGGGTSIRAAIMRSVSPGMSTIGKSE